MTTITEIIEEKGQEGPIRCIFFSEFHHIAGPKITCQVRTACRNILIIFLHFHVFCMLYTFIIYIL